MLLKKFAIFTKADLVLIILIALIFSFFLTLTYNKHNNLNYHNYDFLINNSIDDKYEKIKKEVLNKVYGDLFKIIDNKQKFSLYKRYPNVDYWREKGVLHSNNKIKLSEFINQYEKTLNLNRYFSCNDSKILDNNFELQSCLSSRNLWLEFNDKKKYVSFFKNNIEQKKYNNISHKFFFAKSSLIFLTIFLFIFFIFKKISQQSKI